MLRKKSPPFRPGEVANPAGRPKGARNRIQNSFLLDLQKDWEEHGVEAIRIMRIEKPAEYVKVVSTLLPRQDPEEFSGQLTINIVKFGDDGGGAPVIGGDE